VSAVSGLTSWYGRIYNVPNGLKSLSVTYNGSNSGTCAQSVMLWNWTYGYWSVLDSRYVGPTTATITATAGGTFADYVSNSTGNGDVAVQIRCSRGDYAGFLASGDLLRIAYGV
jgi:hypothetical protein